MMITFRSSLRGFTLIELVISIVLLGLLGAVGVTMISDTFDTTRWINANQASSAKSRYALERLERELREVKFLSTGYYCTGTLTNPATSLTFKQPFGTSKADCTTPADNISIVIDLTGTPSATTPVSLRLQKSGTTSTLTDGVTAFSLHFLKGDGVTETTSNNGGDLRFVVIDLTLNDASGQAIVQRARVALRNL